MKRAGKVKWGEMKVGILIFIAIVFMFYASFKGGGTSIFEPKVTYYAFFENLDGLAEGSPVWLAGVEVGSVSGIEFLDEKLTDEKTLKIEMTVRDAVSYLITPGTEVELGTIGLLGDKYVRVIPGPPSEVPLPDGAIITSRGTAGLAAAMEQLPETAERVNRILAHFESVMTQVDTGSGTLAMLVDNRELAENVAGLVEKSNRLMETLELGTTSLTRDIRLIQEDFHSLATEMLKGQGTIGKLMRDPEPFNNLVSATAHLDSILAKVDAGEGTAGQVVNDQDLYTDLLNLMTRMNTLVKDIQENPKKYFKFSIF